MALRRVISSLMMPACTGLPPGELISITTAREPESSKALRMAATTNSALASAPEAISPLSSTTAVWGVVLVLVAVSLKNTTHNTASTTADHSRRLYRRQRREAFCSLREANTSFSSTSRSQPAPADLPPLAEAAEDTVSSAAAEAVGPFDHRSEPGVTGGWESLFSGKFGELI